MATPSNNPVVSLTNVFKTYKVGEVDVPAVKGVTFTIPRRRFSVIVGPSGSGKTTLLNLIGCLDTPTAGRVIVPQLREFIGVVGQRRAHIFAMELLNGEEVLLCRSGPLARQSVPTPTTSARLISRGRSNAVSPSSSRISIFAGITS
jgi:energy-coupling factor transporter ATP-binding protein EcfA2